MNKYLIALSCMLALTACGNKLDANLENLTSGMNTYLSKKGDLCLGKNTWPIDVTQREMDAGARNAVQMPVLEKVGLVKSSVASVDVKDADTGLSSTIKVMRYDLTDEGKKYYLTRETHVLKAQPGINVQQGDFCAAKLTLDKIVGWELQKTDPARPEAVVTYTYKVTAAPWTANADVQKVLPMVARIVHGAGIEQLKETFRKTDQGWVSVDL
jgi:hypothetical protein